MVQQYNEGVNRATNFDLGDQVWLYIPDHIKGLSNKLRYLWHGASLILGKPSPVNYALELEGRRLAKNVHVARLKPYTPRNRPTEDLEKEDFCDVPLESIPVNSKPTPLNSDPNLDTGDDEVFLVERILNKRTERGIKQCLIKWRGFPRSEATWEPKENILDPELILKFENRQGKLNYNSFVLGKPIVSPRTQTARTVVRLYNSSER